MRHDQKNTIEKLLSRLNRYGDKYEVNTDSIGSRLSMYTSKGTRDVSPRLKPTAFIEWLDAYEEGLATNFERFGVPLVEVTNGVRDLQLMDTLADADETIVRKVDRAVSSARANYFQNYA